MNSPEKITTLMMKRANSGTNNGDLVDRISALPDSILSLILSSIPTKNVVATSVLSKRWISLWKAVHNLDFNFNLCKRDCYTRCPKSCAEGWSAYEDTMKFSCFVNHVMLLHDGGFLNKFSLVWKPICIPSQVISWINTAITRNVHELYLCVNNFDEPFEIPSRVFSCGTLKTIEITGNLFVSDSIDVCLPMLESLRLVSVYFHSDDTFRKLVSGCPMLDYLFVEMDIDIMSEYIIPYRDVGINLFHFVISSTSLRSFVLRVWSEHVGDLPYCSLEIEAAPLLECLCLNNLVTQIFVRESLSSLVIAYFDIDISDEDMTEDVSICNSLVEAICACDCAKTLNISESAFSAISRATIGFSTKFKRLTELKTGANCCYCSSLQDFIQSSDCLEVLVVNKDSPCLDHKIDGYIHTHPNWTTPVEVPRCLSNSLKTVNFDDYGGFDYEREMIRYMLMHGSVLEVMTITCNIKSYDVKLQLLEEICDFPRKSPACRVKFIWWDVDSV